MSSSQPGTSKTSEVTSDPALIALYERLDRIKSKVNPPTPYLLTVPSQDPYRYRHPQLRQQWVQNTPFSAEEAELQYMSNFREWDRGLIRPIGGWDDGKGGLAPRAQATPQSRSATTTPQQPPRKMNLNDYAKKKAIGELGSGLASPAERADRAHRLAHGVVLGHQSNGGALNGIPREKSQEELEKVTLSNVTSTPVVQQTRPSSLLLEESRPELPPPMTPLPSQILEAIEVWRNRNEAGTADYPPDIPEKQASNGPSNVGPMKTKACEGVTQISKSTKVAGGTKRSLVVTLKPKKKIADFRRLLKVLNSSNEGKSYKLNNAHGEHLATDGDPGRPSQASLTESPFVTRMVSPDASRKAAPAPAHSKSRSLTQQELARIDEYDRYHSLAVQLKEKSKSFGKTEKSRALVHYLQSILAWMVSNYLREVYKRKDMLLPNVRPWVDIRSLFERARHYAKLLPSPQLECLAWALEAVVCKQIGSHQSATNEQRLRAWDDAMACTLMADKHLSVKKLMRNFPNTWKCAADTIDQSGILVEGKAMKGDYVLPIFNGSALQAARAGRVLLLEWCKGEGVRCDDELGKMGGAE